MAKDTTLYLHRPTKTQNSIGEWISSVDRIEVFAQVQEISSTEFFAASQIGLAAEKRFLVFSGDYQGEAVLDHDGTNYSVYRTYHSGDYVELYCQIEAGTATQATTDTEVEVDGN